MKKYRLNIEEILSEIRIKNTNKKELILDEKAERLLNKLKISSKYIYKKKVEEWNTYLRSLIYSPLILINSSKKIKHLNTILNTIDIEIIDELYAYIDAFEIIKKYELTKSWKEVEKLLKKQGQTSYSLDAISEILLEYSYIGVEFVNHFNKRCIINNLEMRRYYEEAIKNKNRKENNMDKELSAMEKKVINLIESIEHNMHNSEEYFVKVEEKKDNYQETTLRGKEISITKVETNNSLDYLILDKRFYPTLIKINGLEPIKSQIEMTICDEVQITILEEAKNSRTILDYIEDLNKYIISLKNDEVEQVRTI